MVLKNHPMMDLKERNKDICGKHEKILELFCCDCSTGICLGCLVKDHNEHKVLTLKIGKPAIVFRCVVDAPNNPPCKNPICGSLEIPGKTVNLTQLGTKDWKHWGLNTATDVNRKATGRNLITATVIGSSTPTLYKNNTTTYSWSDGTPDQSVRETPTGIYVSGVGNGFKITVPASTSRQTLRLYFGLWNSVGTVTASLSKTLATWTSIATDLISKIMNICFVIEFWSNTNNDELTVTWNQSDGDGNVTLQSVTLE